jgi:anti-sigma regulatory factor (Ser/Thr protein kinase)
MRRWLDERGVGAVVQSALVLAIGEACSNSIEHAYRGRDAGDVKVEIDETPDRGLAVTVRDYGRFAASAPPTLDRGRGTGLMRKLTLDFSRESTPTGTTVRFRLPMVDRPPA